MSTLFIPKGCPTHRGDRLKADRRLRYLLFYYRPISMKLQACWLLQYLPLLQEVIHIPFSYSYNWPPPSPHWGELGGLCLK